ncbi:hypothetical protein MNBD_ACTINO02-1514 [hydrothermal vent metagenome]|uniref:OmpR/PhoB-type domain-containing protein n=1 Tax=hydrothermal vent metagenome TaxID=652676 RepID=A0A3B0RW37_9ZZZZ
MAEVEHRVLGVLGPLLPTHITRPAQRRLLSVLLLHAGTDLDRDYLFECMWGNDPPRSARNALHVHISGLRSAIPDDIIATTAHGYRIDPDDDAFDVVAFERLATAAHGEIHPSEQLSRTTSALDLWRGGPYQELTDDTFAVPEVARLEERRLGLLELHMQVLLALGQHNEVIPRLRQLVECFPLRERLHEDLMLALYRSGRQAEALRQFQSARQVLGEQIGVEPGPALRDLETRILLHDPDLGPTDLRLARYNLPRPTTSFVGRDEHDAVNVAAHPFTDRDLAADTTFTSSASSSCDGSDAATSFRTEVDRRCGLLAFQDRELLDDVAVFNGWFGLSDIEAVCAGGRDRAAIAAALMRIVDMSLLLVTRCDAGSMRYRMVVPIREILVAPRRSSHGRVEERYVRHYLSRALSWGQDRSTSTATPATVDDNVDNLGVPGNHSSRSR